MIERRQATPQVEKRYKALFKAIRCIESARSYARYAVMHCNEADAQAEAAQLIAYDAALAGMREMFGKVRGDLRREYLLPYGSGD